MKVWIAMTYSTQLSIQGWSKGDVKTYERPKGSSDITELFNHALSCADSAGMDAHIGQPPQIEQRADGLPEIADKKRDEVGCDVGADEGVFFWVLETIRCRDLKSCLALFHSLDND